MKTTYSEDRRTLTLSVDAEEQADLIALRTDEPGAWGTMSLECEILEPLTCNSELGWIDPADTGDMTDAPMLGITGGDDETTREPIGPHGAMLIGGDEQGSLYVPIHERWAFMAYQVRSFLDDLADDGAAVFIS